MAAGMTAPKGYAKRDGKFIGLPLGADRQRHLSTATAT